MNRHKMLMGGPKSEVKKASKPSRKIIKKNTRTTIPSAIGLDGSVSLEETIRILRELESAEKDAGNFTIRVSVEIDGEYDDNPHLEIQIYTERYETEDETAKREEAARKREEKRIEKEAEMKTPKYQRTLINNMNRSIARKMRY